MMAVTMALDQEPIMMGHSASMNMIVPCIIGDGVINGYHHLRGGGGGATTPHQRARG